MILEIVFWLLMEIMSLFTFWLPNSGDVPLLLPWGIDNILVSGVGGYRMLMTVFPPFGTILSAFLIYFGFKIVIRLLRMIPIIGKTID